MTEGKQVGPIVIIPQGELKGGVAITENGIQYNEFIDIPYAKPPVGELRFGAPEPPLPWEGLRDATKFNPDHISIQYHYKGYIIGSEDCLYLNVYTPKLPTNNTELLPVIFYIHGGGFNEGCGIDKYDLGPDYLLEKNVVIVSTNYRLGFFGFLSLDIPEAAGNMGIKDQIMALKWVSNNIEYFGGDKNNVTLLGLSAGAVFVDYIRLAPSAKNLFHKAILQSGNSLNHWGKDTGTKNLLTSILDALGYNGFLDDSLAIYKFLKNASAPSLVKTCKKFYKNLVPERLYFGFVPTVEKDFDDVNAVIVERPYKLFVEGKYHKVPVIQGFCDKEGYLTLFSRPGTVNSITEDKTFFKHWPYKLEENDTKRYSIALAKAYLENQGLGDDSDKLGIEFFNDFDVIAGMWIQSQITASHGTPVYVYEFSYDGNFNYLKNKFNIKRIGAAHADEMGYLFRNEYIKVGVSQDFKIRNIITTFWTNFASNGDPNGLNVTLWPRFSPERPAYLNIDKQMAIKFNYHPNRIEIFKEIYDKYEK
ncbi:juvenile hormone esterase-like isoform X1 [Leptidea sinapis]|uniref:juvenile hormone esterase-like isoform X1 n=1 Tax=Leptidea sinapis TaxID=189913 RepID=UPI00212609CB|nr:juvenile hormone esterase-like isoform X1 [Leptidea sinapis]